MYYFFAVLLFVVSQIFTFHEVVSYSHADPGFSQEQLDKADSIIKKSKKKKVKAVNAENVFKQSCASCHGRKGGLGLAGASDLTASKMPLNERVAMIYYGKGTMQSYKDGMSKEEIVAVAQYLEKLRA